MAIYCHQCGEQRGFPFSAMRTARSACDFCDGFDTYMGTNRRTGRREVMHQLNYSYPNDLLPGPSDVNVAADKEYEGAS